LFNPLSAVIPAGQRKRDLRELGVQVIKGVGELQDFEGPVGTAFGLIGEVFERHPEEAEWIRRALLGVLLVLDPDGFFGGGARPAGWGCLARARMFGMVARRVVPHRRLNILQPIHKLHNGYNPRGDVVINLELLHADAEGTRVHRSTCEIAAFSTFQVVLPKRLEAVYYHVDC